MDAPTLRPLDRGDVPALLEIQHAFTGGGPKWSEGHLDRELHDPARDGGRHVVVAERDGAVVGAAGWVEAGAQMFGSPVLAADAAAAGALLDRLIQRGQTVGAAALRVSTTAADAPKVEALLGRGFAPQLDFLTMARPATAIERPPVPLRRVGLTDVSVALLRDLYNETFAGLANSPPVDDAEIEHTVASSWPEGSGVWLDDGGGAVGFLIGVRERDEDGEHAVVYAVGIRASWRRRGLGALLVGHLLALAAGASLPEVRALIASTNEASLALHRSLGFVERSRITVWEARLGA